MTSATEGYEAVDLKKKKLLEEVLVEERDDAVIKVAKIRKRQPPKLRSKARNIASNIVHYYSGVCVNIDAELLNFVGYSTKSDFNDLCNKHKPCNLNVLSKVITECLAENKELMKVRHQQLSSLQHSDSKCKMKGKHRYPCIASSHIYSTDFIVDDL